MDRIRPYSPDLKQERVTCTDCRDEVLIEYALWYQNTLPYCGVCFWTAYKYCIPARCYTIIPSHINHCSKDCEGKSKWIASNKDKEKKFRAKRLAAIRRNLSR